MIKFSSDSRLSSRCNLLNTVRMQLGLKPLKANEVNAGLVKMPVMKLHDHCRLARDVFQLGCKSRFWRFSESGEKVLPLYSAWSAEDKRWAINHRVVSFPNCCGVDTRHLLITDDDGEELETTLLWWDAGCYAPLIPLQINLTKAMQSVHTGRCKQLREMIAYQAFP